MAESEMKPTAKRDAIRTALLSAGLVLLLGAAAAGGRYHRELRGIYYAARFFWGGNSSWCDRLAELGPAGAPACRLLYRLAPEERYKLWAAEALGECAGPEALVKLAEREDADGPAERELFRMIAASGDAPLPGAEDICEYDSRPPENFRRVERDQPFERLRYELGPYTVRVEDLWSRSCIVSYNAKTGVSQTRWEPWGLSGRSITIISRRPDGRTESCTYWYR